MKKISTLLLFSFICVFVCNNKTHAQATLLNAFSGPDGRQPAGDLLSDGTYLYGLTRSGGTNDKGVIFKIKPDGTAYTKLFDFDSVNGTLPDNSLVSDGTFLYGTTVQGGTSNFGTIFKIKPDGTGFAKLFDFSFPNGIHPHCTLVYDGTHLYGGTFEGGSASAGVLFKIKTDGTGFVKLRDFLYDANGSRPKGSLFYDGTFLYGMAENSGTGSCVNGCGVIYKIMPDGSGYTKLMDFTGAANGSYPSGTFISDGTYLYAMTPSGGINNQGVVFKIKTDGTGFTKLFDFDYMNGPPYGSFVSVGPFLYAMTAAGGTSFRGTIFRIQTDGTAYAKLYDFSDSTGSVGSNPFGSFIREGSALYGLAISGGGSCTPDCGTVFKFPLDVNGVAENGSENRIEIYPNPGNGMYTLTGHFTSFSIYNALGSIVLDSTTGGPKREVDLSAQPEGIYFIRLENEGRSTTLKIIHQ